MFACLENTVQDEIVFTVTIEPSLQHQTLAIIPPMPQNNDSDAWLDLGSVRLHPRLCSPDLEVLEAILKPGMDSRLHRHTRERETFIVLEGEIQVWLEGQEFVLKVGDTLSILPLALHRFGNTGSTDARAMLVLNPGGLFGYFQALHALLRSDAGGEQLTALNERYGLEFVVVD